MLTINLINSTENPDYKITTFPDGEPHIEFITELYRKENYKVICRICNPTDLFILLQVGNILNRAGVRWELDIRYLMSMRMDRVMSFREAFTLEIVASAINSIHPYKVKIFECHSSRALELIHNSSEYRMNRNLSINHGVTAICFPDQGAYERYNQSFLDFEKIVMTKVRENGRVKSVDFLSKPLNVGDTILVVDDLCDGGATFAAVAEKLKDAFPNVSINISVAHLVNPNGLKILESNYNSVEITDSYTDWKEVPSNVYVNKLSSYDE